MHSQLLDYVRDVYDWLESGAHYSTCADRQRLAATVHKALVGTVQRENNLGAAEAETYIRHLHQQRRQPSAGVN